MEKKASIFIGCLIYFTGLAILVASLLSEEEEEIGLDASQHDEEYVQGTLLVQPGDMISELIIKQ